MLGTLRFWLAALLAAASMGRAEETRIIALGRRPLLFADDSGVAARDGLVRMVHPARTRDLPVIEPDRVWEGARVYIYGSVYRDPVSGGFQMWYNTRSVLEQGGHMAATGHVPALRENGADLVLYATSSDGLRWVKPALGLFAYDGSKANNIVFDLSSASILRDDFERDPAKRYKMLGTVRRAYYAAYSADGLRWTSYPRNPVLPYSDTITLAQDSVTGRYLAYHKRPATVRGYPRRVVWLSTSPDFQTWSEPEQVLAPDAEDDAWVSGPSERTEIYDMSVFSYASGFVGLPAVLRVMKERPRGEVRPGQSPLDGPIDTQLATSEDGRIWHRSWPRLSVIPRGPPGAFDGGALLGVASCPVDSGDETWVYYTAINTGHGATLPPKRITIGQAAWRRDGFVSLDAGPAGGSVTTRPLRFPSAEVFINADASRGALRVAVQEVDGRPIAGLGLDDSIPLSRDATRAPARWRGAAGVPTDRPVRLMLAMTNVRLFSLSAAP